MGEVYSHLSEEERQVIQIEVGNGASIRGTGLYIYQDGILIDERY